MATVYTVTGKVVAYKRMSVSSSGNPSFMLAIEEEDGNVTLLQTAANTSLAYGVTGTEYRDEAHTFAVNGKGKVTHVLN